MDFKLLQEMLDMVDCKVSLREILSWTDEQREQAETWAAKVHLRASDNIVRVPTRPRFLPMPRRPASRI